MMTDQFLKDVASKFPIKDKKVLRKANELLKLLSTSKSLNCSESCKAVVCIELASQLCVNSEDIVSRESAIKFSGCKKPGYLNKFNIISKILNLDRVYSVKELCVTLGVSEMESIASGLLEKYKTASDLGNEEDHPMYACAAITAACKSNKVKINSSKLVELSRLKKTEFETLCQKFEALIEVRKKLRGKRKAEDSLLPPTKTELETITPQKAKKKTEAELESEYQEWKQKMLQEE